MNNRDLDNAIRAFDRLDSGQRVEFFEIIIRSLDAESGDTGKGGLYYILDNMTHREWIKLHNTVLRLLND